MLETIQAHEQESITGWQQTREIMYIIYCANTAQNDRVDKQEFMPLPGDNTAARTENKSEMVERWKRLGLL